LGKGPASKDSEIPLEEDAMATARNSRVFQKELVNIRAASEKNTSLRKKSERVFSRLHLS